MSKLINSIVNKDFVEADSILSETVELIMARKLEEAKKMCAAKMTEQQSHVMNKTAAELTRLGVVEEEEVEEETVNSSGKISSNAYRTAQATFTNDVIRGKNKSQIASDVARDDMTPQERMSSNRTQEINTKLKTPAPKAGGYTDARTNKPYVAPKPEILPSHGPTVKGSSQVNTADKSDRVIPASPIKTNVQTKTTTVQKVNEEELDEETLDEARVKIIKARIRGGKIQRRKKVSNVPGMTIRGGKLTRMSPAERRRRKMGQRRGKIKRKAKMNRAMMKRQRSIRKRKALGL